MTAHKYIRGESAVEVSRSIEALIREGRLAPGERLPTVRALAELLDLSPSTVAEAYRRLRRRGLVVGQGRRGTTVSGTPPLGLRGPAPIPQGARDLATGNPDPALLPRFGPLLASLDPAPILYGGEAVLPELRARMSARLEADGVPSKAVAVVGGALDGVERVLGAHLRPGDCVAIEDPGFSNTIELLASLSLVAVPVAVDDAGLLPDALGAALDEGIEAVIATPRAQNPFGSAFDASRARDVRRVLARAREVLVIEDDHAAEVAGAELFPLASARRARWAFVRSVSKSLGPDLRLAVLAGDPETVARVEGRQQIGIRWVSHVLQRLTLALLSDREVLRSLRLAERTYTERREALLEALAERGVAAHGRSGLNVWVPVPEEAAATQAIAAAGWAVGAGERFRLRSGPAIRVTTASLALDEATGVAEAIARVLEPTRLTATA